MQKMESSEKTNINDRHSFVEFLRLFRADLNSNPDEWENKNLDDFLEAMTRYAEDIQGYYNNCENEIGERVDADVPTWRTFADILRGARIYE
jgi:hypothetical protein